MNTSYRHLLSPDALKRLEEHEKREQNETLSGSPNAENETPEAPVSNAFVRDYREVSGSNEPENLSRTYREKPRKEVRK